MSKARSLFALLGLALLLAAPASAQAQSSGSVIGTATILQRVALPNNAVVTIQLADATRSGTPAQVLFEQRFTTNGAQAPFAFNLKYDPIRIVGAGTYIVQGNITVDGRLRYTTTRQYRVITGGNPANIGVVLDAVGLPNTSSQDWMLTLANVLLALALGVHVLHDRLRARLAPPVAQS